jgi:NAD(P)-dependent dehydrogenase (short-subunit alcohol dehydrogenase family)
MLLSGTGLAMSAAVAMVKTTAIKKSAILITGSTNGIGKTTAKNVARSFDCVLIHGRNKKRIRETVRYVGDHYALGLPPAELACLDQCRALAVAIRTVCHKRNLTFSTLAHNAGVYAEQHRMTNDGRTERTFAVNVLAPFVLTSLLLDLVTDRIVILSSTISQSRSIHDWDDLHYQRRIYSSHGAYSESKLLGAMLTMEMADRLSKRRSNSSSTGSSSSIITTPTCNCLDPGTTNVKWKITGSSSPFGVPIEKALDEAWLCTSPDVANVSGGYFTGRTARRAAAAVYDVKERQKLWTILTNLAPDAAAAWDNYETDEKK